jgi:3-phosphoshikimate 1-carboxyvinyltransferase
MGAEITITPEGNVGPEPVGEVSIRMSRTLRGVEVVGSELVQSAIDEIPLVAALAPFADNVTRIRQAEELRDKDTDRIVTTVNLLRAFGVPARTLDDGLEIPPSPVRAPPRIVLPPDHRIAFAALVLAVAAGGGTEIVGMRAAAVSNPRVLAEIRSYIEVE